MVKEFLDDARKMTLKALEVQRTCFLANMLCRTIKMNLPILEPEDVHKYCMIVSGLCLNHKCVSASSSCSKAAKAILKGDKKSFLKFCVESQGFHNQKFRKPDTMIGIEPSVGGT